MLEKFGFDWKDEDGTTYEVLYWTTKGRFFAKYRINGIEQKTRRISQDRYFSEYECYMNW